MSYFLNIFEKHSMKKNEVNEFDLKKYNKARFVKASHLKTTQQQQYLQVKHNKNTRYLFYMQEKLTIYNRTLKNEIKNLHQFKYNGEKQRDVLKIFTLNIIKHKTKNSEFKVFSKKKHHTSSNRHIFIATTIKLTCLLWCKTEEIKKYKIRMSSIIAYLLCVVLVCMCMESKNNA